MTTEKTQPAENVDESNATDCSAAVQCLDCKGAGDNLVGHPCQHCGGRGMQIELPETMNDVPTFMHKNGKSTVRNCAEAAMMECGLDPREWRLRDKVIWAMNPWIQAEAEARVNAADSRDLLRKHQDAVKALEFILGFDDVDDLIRDIASKAIQKTT